METISYGAFSQTVHHRLRAERVPLNVTIEVTRRCPLTCSHCYNNLPVGDRQARQTELTLDEHCRILDELAAAGALWLLFTGGEILARPDFLEIYTHARRRGFLVTLYTNGILLTPAIADHLVQWRPFAVEITLYGRTRETYERLTGVRGSYDRCLRGIRLLLERGLPLRLKTVALTVNRHELRDMQRFAEEDLGVPFKFDAMMSPRVDCSQSPLAVRLRPEECVALDLEDPKRMREWRMFADRFLGPSQPAGQEDRLYHCGGGVTAFAIDPYGRMSICVLSQVDQYDLRTGTVQDGWDHFLRRVRAKPASRRTKCTACTLKAMCGMCPANGELETGDPESPVDFLCQVAHLRAHAFGLPIAPHGDCEYCEDGEQHDALMRALARLHEVPRAAPPEGRSFLPMASAIEGAGSCSTGGCAGCGG